MKIRRLSPSDDRGNFDCGDVDLNRFFRKYAGQNQFRQHIGTTYIAEGDDGMAVGFATVVPGQVETDGLPAAVRKGLPRYPMPVLRLARLGVDVRAQRRGVGKALLRFVLELSLQMTREFGCIGVIVDSLPSAVPFYRTLGFVPLALVSGRLPDRPEPGVLFLSVKEIEAAARTPAR